MISEQSKQEIYSKINIVEVIEDFISLKRKGKDYQALCPFHNEKTPSFSVSPAKNIFKCFGCQKGGDAITFLMESEGYAYYDALKYLAQKYHVSIQYNHAKSDDYDREQKLKESLLIALNFAKVYYKQLLKTDSQKRFGLDYFLKRGLKSETIQTFELGYSENSETGFLKHAEQNEYSPDILEQAGLIRSKGNRAYDYFRNRVMFPIKNHLGKVVGFGARTLKTADKVKYLNSPETLVYRKNQILYGLFEAKSEIQKQNRAFLVEGYLDVLTLSQAGIQNVVASAGIALTQDQIILLKRFTQNLVLLFDGDSAGQKATLRAMELSLETDLQVEIVSLPEDEDPNSLIQSLGRAQFEKYIEDTKLGFVPFILKDFDLSKSIAKRKAVEYLVRVISLIPNAIGRRVFFEEAAQAVNLEVEFLIVESNKLTLKKGHHDRFQDELPLPIPPLPLDHYDNHIDESSSQPLLKSQDSDKARSPHEREFLRLLLLHGDKILDENRIANYLFDGIKAIPFVDPFVKQVLELYRSQSADRPLALKTFQNICSEKKISGLESIFNEDYQPSESWSRFRRVPKLYDHHLKKTIATNLKKLEYFYLDARCREISVNVMEPDTEKIQDLEKFGKRRRELGKSLNFMF